jgi:hypothetical protein
MLLKIAGLDWSPEAAVRGMEGEDTRRAARVQMRDHCFLDRGLGTLAAGMAHVR